MGLPQPVLLMHDACVIAAGLQLGLCRACLVCQACVVWHCQPVQRMSSLLTATI